jgi:hypothetical protein
MNELRITMTQNQIALMLEILQPYAELSLSLTNQYKVQMAGAAEIPHAKKLEEQEKK